MAKILIVDDNPEDLKVMKMVLQKEKFEVVTVSNGAEALDLLKREKPAAILIDILLPVLSGYDLLRLLREKHNHDIPAIYVSIVPKTDADLSGVDGFIQKPFSPKSFVEEVKRVIKKTGGKK